MNQKISTGLGVVIILIMALTTGVFVWNVYEKNPIPKFVAPVVRQKPITKVCPMDAKLCPDGSSVGRSGRSCEFTECPKVEVADTSKWRAYKNKKYGLELKFPDWWSNYKVEEIDSSLVFNLKLANPYINDYGEKIEYGTLFNITAYSKKEWADNQCAHNPSVSSYLAENNHYIFGYNMGHDDTGYDAFPEPVQDAIYRGPFWDIRNLILPTFKFTSASSSLPSVKCAHPKESNEDVAVYSIGKKGGFFCSADKKMWLEVFADSVLSDEDIKITKINSSELGLYYDISPLNKDTLEFLNPVMLKMKYELPLPNGMKEDEMVLADPRGDSPGECASYIEKDDQILSTIINKIEKTE